MREFFNYLIKNSDTWLAVVIANIIVIHKYGESIDTIGHLGITFLLALFIETIFLSIIHIWRYIRG